MPLHPRRAAAPLLAALFPLLWLLNRERSLGAAGIAPDLLRTALLVVAAVVVAVTVAAVLTPRLPEPSSLPGPLRPIVAPADAVLAIVGTLTAALGLFVLLGILLPSPLDPVAVALGVLLGWPLSLTWSLTVVVGNALLPASAYFPAELLATVLGTALSALWLFVLAGWLARLVGREAVQRNV
ncbi:hypothetical protein [Halolamina litorea]|uniref:Uncharacterized protein n=1 Tax=Halolamina litorea TaxID=1515593 RepID=A0ABD6BQT5_9EURY|nr:hypothetical protein [Halolamina litorea]